MSEIDGSVDQTGVIGPSVDNGLMGLLRKVIRFRIRLDSMKGRAIIVVSVLKGMLLTVWLVKTLSKKVLE